MRLGLPEDRGWMDDAIPHGTRSGYSHHMCRCPVCVAHKSDADRSYYERNRERVKAQARARHDASRDSINARRREAFASLSEDEKVRARQAKRPVTAEQRALQYERTRKYARTDKGRAASRRSVARRREVPLTSEADEYVEILLADPCAYCGRPGGEIDHIEAVAAGGTGEWDNLTAACRSCNARKWSKSLLGYLLERRL